MLRLGEDHLTFITLVWVVPGVSLHMTQIAAQLLKPQLTTLANMFPYVIVPVPVRFQFNSPRVQIPAVGFFALVETEFFILLQENSKDVCISDEGIHV
jgi:hypothetical protein